MAPPCNPDFIARLDHLQRKLGRELSVSDLRAALHTLLDTKDSDLFFDGYWFLLEKFITARDNEASIEVAELAVLFQRNQMTLISLSERLHFANRKSDARAAMLEAVDIAFRQEEMFVYASLAQIRHHLKDNEGEAAKIMFRRLMSKLSACPAAVYDTLETDVLPQLRQAGAPKALLAEYQLLADSQRVRRQAH